MIPGAPLFMPTIRKKAAPDPGGGYSFTMTAGLLTGDITGYNPGTSTGGIDKEPISGNPLLVFITSATQPQQNIIAFMGDTVILLAGLSVWVSGIQYPFDAQTWTYNPGLSATMGIWTPSNSPKFIVSEQYFVEIK